MTKQGKLRKVGKALESLESLENRVDCKFLHKRFLRFFLQNKNKNFEGFIIRLGLLKPILEKLSLLKEHNI